MDTIPLWWWCVQYSEWYYTHCVYINYIAQHSFHFHLSTVLIRVHTSVESVGSVGEGVTESTRWHCGGQHSLSFPWLY